MFPGSGKLSGIAGTLSEPGLNSSTRCLTTSEVNAKARTEKCELGNMV
jgi:hypothetical protein